jgi:hypothetical protein
MISRVVSIPLLLIAAVVLFGRPAPAHAALLSYEGFDYPNSGSALLNTKAGGTGWGGPWQFSGVAATNNAGFNVSQDDTSLNTSAYPFTPVGDRVLAAGPGSGANTAQADRLLPTTFDLGAEGNVIYASLLFRKDTGPATGSDNMEFTFLSNMGIGTPLVQIRVGSTSAERFFVFDAGSVNSTFENVILGQTYFVVLRVESHASSPDVYSVVTYTNGETVPTTEPATWEGVRNTSASNAVLDGVRLWIGTVTSGQYDEIRIGNTWESVAVLVPEPASLSLFVGFLFPFLISRHRRHNS